VFEQAFDDIEDIIFDGGSQDGSAALISFWTAKSLVNAAVSEPDDGVCNAVNKGMRMAIGQYVILLNSSDVFADIDVLTQVHDVLASRDYNGVLGWGN